jgi:hypothetical protein
MPMGDMTGPQGQGPGTGQQMGQMAGNPMGAGAAPPQAGAPPMGGQEAPAGAPGAPVIEAFRTLAIFVAGRLEQGDPAASQMQQGLQMVVQAMQQGASAQQPGAPAPQGQPAPAPAPVPAQQGAPAMGAPGAGRVQMTENQGKGVPAMRGAVPAQGRAVPVM